MIERVIFVNRRTIERTYGLQNWAVVSIYEDNLTNLQQGWYGVYRSKFDDVDPVRPYSSSKTLMTLKHADDIVAFIESVAPNITVLFVNCKGGISRSAAVAKWTAERFSLPFNEHYAEYNKYVYRLMQEAGEKHMLGQDLAKLLCVGKYKKEIAK